MSAANDTWKVLARRAADAALDIYDRDTVEFELALYLSRALRELEARD